jgi:hypothetical protein
MRCCSQFNIFRGSPMFDTIFGLPVHALVVHATVVVVPTAALTVALAAGLPRFRRWAGFLPLLLSLGAVLLVPVTTASGEELERRVGRSALVEKHVHLADGLLLPVLVLALAALGLYWVLLKERAVDTEQGAGGLDAGLIPLADRIGAPGRPGMPVMSAILLVAALSSVFTLVQVARIGHSGAEAAWHGVATSTSPAAGG